jgi:hypothetical protein
VTRAAAELALISTRVGRCGRRWRDLNGCGVGCGSDVGVVGDVGVVAAV